MEMKVHKRILIPIKEEKHKYKEDTSFGTSIMMVNTTYTKKDGLHLLQLYSEEVASDTSGKCFQRTSKDNGKTWSNPILVFEPQETEEGVIRWGESCLFLDEGKECIFHFYNLHLYPKNIFSREVQEYTRIFYRISFDEGKTFSNGKQIIQKGFNETNWAEDVIYGKNSIAISFCAPLKLNTGKILLPCQKVPLEYKGDNPFLISYVAGCFIGEWKENKIEWELSQMMKIDPKLSSRGLCEPTIAQLYNRELLMIMRGSNYTIPSVPGYKWFSISKDGGYTWSSPTPLKYDTGENFFSPATGSRLIRSTKNKKLYWIGNIVKENPDGNRPRYPLQIAEVDEEKKAIKKHTVNIIEDKRESDSPFVQFSNFRVYEDRETGEFVLIMARIQERGEKDLSSPAYEYRIEVL